MKKLMLIIFLISGNALALEAVVIVLETPLLKYRSYEAPVVQYLRKGDILKIHPSVANEGKFEHYAPSAEKLKTIRKKLNNDDPIFRGENENTAYLEDEFIPTLDRQGNVVYVLSEHIYVYFGDSREFKQKQSKHDPTDYRLEEPLPKKYPLITPVGYRGQFLAGITQPYYESYPYKDSIKRKGYTSPLDLNLTFLKLAPGRYQERLFIGGSINFRRFENTYTFPDRRYSQELGMRWGVGPTISYDAFKGEKNRVNLSGTILINLDFMTISQSLDERQDSRIYSGYSTAPRLSLQYHRKEILEELDLVLATSLEMGSATIFQAKNGGAEASWWHHLGNDKFTTRATFSVGGFIGLQSAY